MSDGRGATVLAAVLGGLALLSLPLAALASRESSDVSLLGSLYIAVPVAIVLGVLALVMARRVSRRQARSVFTRGRGLARLARILAWAGLFLGCVGAVALAVYSTLRWAQ